MSVATGKCVIASSPNQGGVVAPFAFIILPERIHTTDAIQSRRSESWTLLNVIAFSYHLYDLLQPIHAECMYHKLMCNSHLNCYSFVFAYRRPTECKRRGGACIVAMGKPRCHMRLARIAATTPRCLTSRVRSWVHESRTEP